MSEENQTEKDGWGSRYKCSPVGERGTNCVSPAARAFRIPTILIVHIFGRGGSWIHPVGLFSNLPVIVCYYQLAYTTRDNNLKEDTESILRPNDASNALMTGSLSLAIARRFRPKSWAYSLELASLWCHHPELMDSFMFDSSNKL